MKASRGRRALRELGWRLAHHRSARQMTRDRLAEQAGVGVRELAAIERGRRSDLRYTVVLRLCGALDISLADLFAAELARAPRMHDVPVPAATWAMIEAGVQSFLLLRNGANYRAGDRAALVETLRGRETGRVAVVELTYLLYGESVGLAPGCIVASIQPARDAWTVAPALRHYG
jgi:transcriptional regulator with XRE-family HTH domain